jgi:hypothetical protein
MVEESAAGTHNLADEVGKLRAAVTVFKLGDASDPYTPDEPLRLVAA